MIGFLNPFVLLGLRALPLLWWLLRAVPPAPSRRRFPGVRLLLGLKDPESIPDHTPWWLLLLRLTALAVAIIAFAEPVLNPRGQSAGSGRLLVLLDGGWASAPDWRTRLAKVEDILATADRPVALRLLTSPLPAEGDLGFTAAQDLAPIVQSLIPAPIAPDREGFANWLTENPQEPFETIWLSDGIGNAKTLTKALTDQGALTLITGLTPALSLLPARIEAELLVAPVHRVDTTSAQTVPLIAIGPSPDGIEQVLWRTEARFVAGDADTLAPFDMPFELRNRIKRIALAEGVSAGVVVLADVPGTEEVKYIYGTYGEGFFSYLGGHDPEDYQHLVGDPPTDLSRHPHSPGYRLILNNILFPSARRKPLKT
ncbi:MAG: BatA domain-containing protein [Candidatus Hydrothermae bacterium]|nr:BatA domain-containing protein [Candidatus Hydrothermae bacterium]